MLYKEIDLNTFQRKEHFNHFKNNNLCSYSLTVNINITDFLTEIQTQNLKFYPAIIYAISKCVNETDQMKMSMHKEKLVMFNKVEPSYTVLNKDTDLFSSLFTEYSDDFKKFYSCCNKDIKKYSSLNKLCPVQPPENCFFISSLPWMTFTSFNLNIFNSNNFFLPIFTMGKYFESGDKTLMPLAIQIHHAVCDGYHVSRFLEKLQLLLNDFKNSRLI